MMAKQREGEAPAELLGKGEPPDGERLGGSLAIVKISDPTDVDERRKRAEWVASGGEKLGWQRSRAYFDVPEAMYRR